MYNDGECNSRLYSSQPSACSPSVSMWLATPTWDTISPPTWTSRTTRFCSARRPGKAMLPMVFLSQTTTQKRPKTTDRATCILRGGRGCYDFMCRMLCHKCIAYEFIVVYVKTYRSHCEILVTCCTRMLRVTLHGCLFRLGDRFFMKCRPNHLCYIDLF